MTEWGTIFAAVIFVCILFAAVGKFTKKLDSGDLDEEYELEEYGELCLRIERRLEETRELICSTKQSVMLEDLPYDREILQWKLEYLQKQEKWLTELMCGGME